MASAIPRVVAPILFGLACNWVSGSPGQNDQNTRADAPGFDWRRVDPELQHGITAGASYTDGTILLARGKRAQVYSPEENTPAAIVDLPFSLDGAMRLSKSDVVLFSGSMAVLYDHNTSHFAGEVELAELGLPFEYVDAAGYFDQDRWVVISGTEYGFVSGADRLSLQFDGPYPVSDLCVPAEWRGVDAAINTLDGHLTLTRGRSLVEVNLLDGKCSSVGDLGSGTKTEPSPIELEAARLRPVADLRGLQAPFAGKITAAARVGDERDLLLLFSGREACLYSPWAGKEVARFSVEAEVSMALRLDEDHVLLSAGGDSPVVFDWVRRRAVAELSDDDSELPAPWTGVDAAVELEDHSWLLISGSDTTLHTSAGDPRNSDDLTAPLSSLYGMATWSDGVDAAVSLNDGRILFFRAGEVVVLDLETRAATAPLSLAN